MQPPRIVTGPLPVFNGGSLLAATLAAAIIDPDVTNKAIAEKPQY
jgi:hypothetical protein